MELFISQEDLVRALGGVQGIVERRSTHQVLGHALLTAEGDEFRVTATDTELTGELRFPARVEVPGQRSVSAGHLFQVARALPSGVVHLQGTEGHQLVVDAPPAHYRLVGLPPSEFPPFPSFEASATLTVRSADFRRVIDSTVFAIPADDQRYGLNGGHLEAVEGPDGTSRIRLVTTDGSRLCYAEAGFEGEFGMGRHMLLPRKALLELKRFLDSSDQPLEIAFGERAARFRVGQVVLHTRLVDGEFPAYRSVLPRTFQRRARVDRAAFMDALRRVALEASDQANTVRMSFSSDEVVLSARAVDQGEAKHPVPLQLEGEPIQMGFNVRFFQDVVSCLEDAELSIELGEALSPCVVRPAERDDALFIIMPIRLD